MAIDPKKYNWNTTFNQNPDVSDEERAQARSKGGTESTRVRRQRRKFADIFDELLSLTNSEGEGVDELISMQLIAKALQGDLQAYTLIRDQLSEKPKDQLEISSRDVININVTGEEENSESDQPEPEQEPVHE